MGLRIIYTEDSADELRPIAIRVIDSYRHAFQPLLHVHAPLRLVSDMLWCSFDLQPHFPIEFAELADVLNMESC